MQVPPLPTHYAYRIPDDAVPSPDRRRLLRSAPARRHVAGHVDVYACPKGRDRLDGIMALPGPAVTVEIVFVSDDPRWLDCPRTFSVARDRVFCARLDAAWHASCVAWWRAVGAGAYAERVRRGIERVASGDDLARSVQQDVAVAVAAGTPREVVAAVLRRAAEAAERGKPQADGEGRA